MTNKTHDFKYTIIKNEDNNIIFVYLFQSIPGSILLVSLVRLMIYTMIKPLIHIK